MERHILIIILNKIRKRTKINIKGFFLNTHNYLVFYQVRLKIWVFNNCKYKQYKARQRKSGKERQGEGEGEKEEESYLSINVNCSSSV